MVAEMVGSFGELVADFLVGGLYLTLKYGVKKITVKSRRERGVRSKILARD